MDFSATLRALLVIAAAARGSIATIMALSCWELNWIPAIEASTLPETSFQATVAHG
jgi:hypothetical protein